MKLRHDVRAAAGALLGFLALALGGCATTQVETTWKSPDYAGKPVVGRVMVIGLTRDETVRRLYEDAMAVRLHERGIEAVRSYDYVNGRLNDADGSVLLEAARKAGATRMLSTALVAQVNAQRIRMEPTPSARRYNYGSWYGTYWPMGYTRVETYDYERYYAVTSLLDVQESTVYWLARTKSEISGGAAREMDGFVGAIVDALVDGGVL